MLNGIMDGRSILLNAIEKEWREKTFADLKVICKDNQELKMNRVILAALFPIIRKSLEEDGNPEVESVLLIPDVDKVELEEYISNVLRGGAEEISGDSGLTFLISEPSLLMEIKIEEGLNEEVMEEDQYNPIEIKLTKALKEKKSTKSASQNPIWNYFSLTSNKSKVTCNDCGQKIRYGTVAGPMTRHLKAFHPEAYEEINKSLKKLKKTKDSESDFDEESPKKKEKRKRKPKETGVKEEKEKDNSDLYVQLCLEIVNEKSNLVWQHFQQSGWNSIQCFHCQELLQITEVGSATHVATEHLQKSHPDLEVKENSAFDVIGSFFIKTSDTRFICGKCDVVLQHQDLKVHLEEKHPDGFEKLIDQDSHINQLDRRRNGLGDFFEIIVLEGEATYNCQSCQEKVVTTDKNFIPVINHLRLMHEILFRQFLMDCGMSDSEIEDIFSKRARKRGPKCNSDEDPASRTCPDCGKLYSKRKGMLTHRDAVHSGKRPFICSTCGMSFARKETFKRHNHNQVIEKPFLCAVCGKTFARRHMRDIHERAHSGDKRHPCSYCEKRFLTNQKKMIHERIHTGEKPFECHDCGKKFVQKHQLQTHTRIHTGDRPYTCDHCDLRFRHLSTRAKHNCSGRPKEQVNVVTPHQLSLLQSQGATIQRNLITDPNGVPIRVFDAEKIII